MLNKPLILALLFFISLSGLFGYTSYHFYGEKQALKERLDVCQTNTKVLENSLLKQEKRCAIADSISTEYQSERGKVKELEEDTLVQIDKLQTKQKKVVQNESKDATSPGISLDSKLPDNLVKLLQSSCVRAKGRACDDS